jgi:hypothetical protein
MFENREEAGRRLGGELAARAALEAPGAPPPLVLALPRGGVPVGAGVAECLRAPLEVRTWGRATLATTIVPHPPFSPACARPNLFPAWHVHPPPQK